MSAAPAAGWYPDPERGEQGLIRFWDGTKWTDRTRERPAAGENGGGSEQGTVATTPSAQPDQNTTPPASTPVTPASDDGIVEELRAVINFERRGVALGALLATIVLVIIGFLFGVFGDDEPHSRTARTAPNLASPDSRPDPRNSARTARTAIETYATKNDGSYAAAQSASLAAIEPALQPLVDSDRLLVVEAGKASYSLVVEGESGVSYAISRSSNGTVAFTCEPRGEDECPGDGDWASS